jgi:hypothetical protein
VRPFTISPCRLTRNEDSLSSAQFKPRIKNEPDHEVSA